MYLARKIVHHSLHYWLRETYREGAVLKHRDLYDLGIDPGRFIHYSGESSFHVDETLVTRLTGLGRENEIDRLEDLLYPFIDPYVKQKTGHFRERQENRSWRPMDRKTRQKATAATHIFDKRRLQFLRLGQTSPLYIDKSPALYRVLLEKSRDEIEQLLTEMEMRLSPHEYLNYLFSIFDLQRFFKQSYARTIPQALDRDRIDELVVQEICQLDSDLSFWQGFPRSRTLPGYLKRYVIMYFDMPEEQQGPTWNSSARFGFHRTNRGFRPPPASSDRMSLDKAASVFGMSKKEVALLNRRELTKVYRKKAHELHPDKGGDTKQFVALTNAYDELMRGRQ